MTFPAMIDRRPARLLISGMLTLIVALSLTLPGASPAAAGTNRMDDGYCTFVYNYADVSTGYLYASTWSDWHAWPEPCVFSTVSIRIGGCTGELLAYAEDTNFDGLASVSYVLHPTRWLLLRSTHHGWTYYCMPFNY